MISHHGGVQQQSSKMVSDKELLIPSTTSLYSQNYLSFFWIFLFSFICLASIDLEVGDNGCWLVIPDCSCPGCSDNIIYEIINIINSQRE